MSNLDTLIDTATSEVNTSEDWSAIIKICELVEANPSKCRDTVNILIKKLNHKNVNVVLYSLTLANALVQNCGLTLKQEISSRAYLQTLMKLVNNNNTHITVRNRILDVIQTWANDFKNDSSLDYMVEVYQQLKSDGLEFPKTVASPVKKSGLTDKEKEEEELQLALALSLSQEQTKTQPTKSDTKTKEPPILFQVRALYDFNPTEAGELKLTKGDIINVYDNSTFPDWWKGSHIGQIGIFPANYVEKISTSIPKQNTQLTENAIILQNLSKVLQLKQNISKADPLGNNPKENEKLQMEYQQILEIVPQVIKCANQQRKKQDDLAILHERFGAACLTYQKLMNSYTATQRHGRIEQPFPNQGYQPNFGNHPGDQFQQGQFYPNQAAYPR
ncbi:hypothetical protein BC833DRAFT_585848 [Globomyces pollinis-pini]|nr:hypothetical protein BC833DRAFT_585848 [Globomyces pollinis-pini]